MHLGDMYRAVVSKLHVATVIT